VKRSLATKKRASQVKGAEKGGGEEKKERNKKVLRGGGKISVEEGKRGVHKDKEFGKDVWLFVCLATKKM